MIYEQNIKIVIIRVISEWYWKCNKNLFNLQSLKHSSISYLLLSSKNSDTMRFSGKLIELEKNNLSEVTQTQKDKHGVYSFISIHKL